MFSSVQALCSSVLCLCMAYWLATLKNSGTWTCALFITSVLLLQGCHRYNTLYKRNGHWSPLSSADTALVTGGARGLGLEMVKLLLVRNVKVIVLDKNTILDDFVREEVVHEHCDLSDETKLRECISRVYDQHGYPTILINNAAMRHNESLQHISYKKINQLITVNTLAPLTLMKETLKTTNNRLYVINVSSILGMVSPANLSIYSATKAALISLHDSVSHEHAGDGSKRFLLVTPGQLNTDMFADVTPPKQFIAPVLDARSLAQTIIHKCDLGERGVVNGPLYTYLIPLLRLMPHSVGEFCRWLSEMDTSVKDTDTANTT